MPRIEAPASERTRTRGQVPQHNLARNHPWLSSLPSRRQSQGRGKEGAGPQNLGGPLSGYRRAHSSCEPARGTPAQAPAGGTEQPPQICLYRPSWPQNGPVASSTAGAEPAKVGKALPASVGHAGWAPEGSARAGRGLCGRMGHPSMPGELILWRDPWSGVEYAAGWLPYPGRHDSPVRIPEQPGPVPRGTVSREAGS